MLRVLEEHGHAVSTYEWLDGNMPSVMEQDWVIHIGAISSTTERDVEKIMRQNVDFTCQLYDICKTYGINFQFSSSASVYGLISTFREDALVDPRTPYAWSKYLCERYITQRMGGNITQMFRYFNVYGPEGEEHKGDQASPFFKFKKQSELGKIELFENSNMHHRDFINVKDVVDTQIKFLSVKESGIFNIGAGQTMSFLDVASQFDGEKVEIPMPDVLKSSYQYYTCADMTKTRKALNET